MPWHPTVIASQILSVHAALVPVGSKGTVLMFGGDEHWSDQAGRDNAPADPANVDRTALYDVASKIVTRTSSPTTDVFCAGHAFMGDGRLLVGGGTEAWGGTDPGGPGGGHVHQHGTFGGHRACWVYNHHQNNWTRARNMNFATGFGEGGGRWYPSIITLPSGDLVAFGGHPSRESQQWHENDIPERYSVGSNSWSWYPNDIPFEHSSLPGNWFPRISLVRGGWIFITTRHNNQCRFFDPDTGNLVGPVVAAPSSPYNSGWDYSVIQLPLVPGDNFRSRIMAVDGTQPQMIELNLDAGAPTPTWVNAGNRQGSAMNKSRTFACPVYLPTGQVLLSGGINGSDDADAVKEPEIYTPDIDWNTRSYNAGAGTWQTVEEPAQIARNYHTVALLLPDGSVFTASSSKDGGAGNPDTAAQKNIEIYFPSYYDNANRPEIVSTSESLSYVDTGFTIETPSAAQAASIRKVALIRCGSVTHTADFDQRYVALNFIHENSTSTLEVTFPNDPTVVPPGNYMVWIVDQNDLPCQVAKFVRVAHRGCRVITDRSTFSEDEVLALGGGGEATFWNAIYVHYDGFIHTEHLTSPTVSVTWADNNTPISTDDFELEATGRLLELYPPVADTPQRITYVFRARFKNLNLYAGFTGTRQMRVTFTHGAHVCTQTLDLTQAPNPYMIDIDPSENNPHWRSTDVRVFNVHAGQTKFGDITQDWDNPIQFIRQCLDKLNNQANDGNALFEGLSTSAKLDLAWMGMVGFEIRPIYNYAIARVRYRATTTTAQRVRCFFRMFNVATTGLAFNANDTYRRTNVGPDTVPLVGTVGGEIASIPFFASERVETVQGRSGATSMTSQVLDPTYEIQNIAPDSAGDEVTVYFGCWLDINQFTKRIPITPGGSDGPWLASSCRSIQELTRGLHMCIVSELFYELDPTLDGETPGSSDNLAQRNLAILNSANPGGTASHTVGHPFEIKPSGAPFDLPSLLTGVATNLIQPDELIFLWHDLPPDSEVTVYLADLNTAKIQELGALRQSPLACEFVDAHTLKLSVAGATWIPIPGGRDTNIPALLNIQLPYTVLDGDVYRLSIHQVSGATGRIIGSCEFRIEVSKAELIRQEEERSLSVLKHVVTTIPPDNRWYQPMTQYVHQIGLRVDALGGDAATIHANPDGSGRPNTGVEPQAIAGLRAEAGCTAPVFHGSSGINLWLRGLLYVSVIIWLLPFIWLPSARCVTRQFLFRITHGSTGNANPTVLLSGSTYADPNVRLG